jgi:PKD repeat protein
LVRFQLTLPSGSPPTLAWAFGDGHYLNGSAASDSSPAHVYDSAGLFRCLVTATYPSGSVNASTLIDVNASNLTVGLSASPSLGHYPLTVWLNATVRGGTGTYVAFYWAFGDGNVGSGLSVRYTYASPGRYQANFTATDTGGISANASTTITVLAASTGVNRSSASGGAPSYPFTTPLALTILGLAGLGALGIYGTSRRFRAPPGARGSTALETPSAPPAGGPTAPPAVIGATPTAAVGGAGRAVAMESAPIPLMARPAPLSTPTRITDALLRHLVGLPQLYPGDLPSKAWTQAGIAEAVGAGQSAVSRVLRRLIAAGIVTSETRHVAGSPRRVRIYRLTDRGERLGRALRESPAPPRHGTGP